MDLWLFDLLNADAFSPPWLIEAVAEYSEHMPSLVISCLLAFLVLGSARLRKGVVCCLAAMLVAWCLTRLIRWGFPLERPYDLGLGKVWIEHGSRPRFPSLHASVAFAFAHGFSMWCTWGRMAVWGPVLAWAAALFIGWSRVYIGVHLPFDVVAGLLVGLVSVYMVRGVQLRALASWARLGGKVRP